MEIKGIEKLQIKGTEKLQAEKNLTIEDLSQGDVFIFLTGDYAFKPIMITEYDNISLAYGFTVDKYEYLDTPVKKVKCCLVIEE